MVGLATVRGGDRQREIAWKTNESILPCCKLSNLALTINPPKTKRARERRRFVVSMTHSGKTRP